MRDPKKARSRTALALLAAGGLIGCGPTGQRTHCMIGVSGTGAVLGALGGGFGVGKGMDDPDDGEIAAGAAGGLVVGGLIGWGLSYLICDEDAPPPPPPPAAAPPAPPPPPTERRGG